MTDAYKCDRCDNYYDESDGKYVVCKVRDKPTASGKKTHNRDLCQSCHDDLEKFMDNGGPQSFRSAFDQREIELNIEFTEPNISDIFTSDNSTVLEDQVEMGARNY